MEFEITRASNTDRIWKEYPQIKENFKIKEKDNVYIIEISTLEDLLKLRELIKEDLVITDGWVLNNLRIIIYDDYLE